MGVDAACDRECEAEVLGFFLQTIKDVAAAIDPNFCNDVAHAYRENPLVGCDKILPLLIQDSSSVANSVLGWLTNEKPQARAS
jgi:hypothetical protein